MSKRGKSVTLKTCVEEILADVPMAIDELKEEMTSWRDALEDKFSGTEKYERVSEAADTLDNDLETLCGTLRDALEKAAEGEEAVEACPEHAAGTPCPACRWNGVLPTVLFERFDPPQSRRIAGSRQLYVGQIVKGSGKSSWFTDVARFEAALAARTAPPPRREAVVGVEPIAAFVDVLTREMTHVELQPYKGKSLSRQDRLGTATGLLHMAVDEARSALAAHKEPPQTTSAEVVDRVDEIESAVDEVEMALDELDGVEFPGMYG